MARVLAIVPDLMLSSRVVESLRSAGHDVRSAGSLSGTEGGIGGGADAVDVVVADLDQVDPESLAALAPPAIGFYSHVDVETRQRAERAGVQLVVPRSRMARELPQLVVGLLDQPDKKPRSK